MKSNKEVIEKLVEYYLKQDPERVARLCANFAVDLNRFLYIDYLDKDERDEFLLRMTYNVSNIHNLVREDDEQEIDLRHWPSKSDV